MGVRGVEIGFDNQVVGRIKPEGEGLGLGVGEGELKPCSLR